MAKSLVAQLVGISWCFPNETFRVQIPPPLTIKLSKKKTDDIQYVPFLYFQFVWHERASNVCMEYRECLFNQKQKKLTSTAEPAAGTPFY